MLLVSVKRPCELANLSSKIFLFQSNRMLWIIFHLITSRTYRLISSFILGECSSTIGFNGLLTVITCPFLNSHWNLEDSHRNTGFHSHIQYSELFSFSFNRNMRIDNHFFLLISCFPFWQIVIDANISLASSG